MRVEEYAPDENGNNVLINVYEIDDPITPSHEDLETRANELIAELQDVLARLQMPF